MRRKCIAIKNKNADYLDENIRIGVFKNFSQAVDALVEKEIEEKFLDNKLKGCKQDISFRAVAERILGENDEY